MQHPITDILDQLQPDATYTTRDLASLLDVARSTITALVGGGYLPGGTLRGAPGHGGREWVWTGAALAEARTADLPGFDHALYAPATLWRWGCRCEQCLGHHNEDSLWRRREQAAARFPARKRQQLLASVAAGVQIPDAAEELGVSSGQAWGYARVDEEFARALDEAGQALCVDAADPRCGSTAGHRWLACRGTACRVAKRATRNGALVVEPA